MTVKRQSADRQAAEARAMQAAQSGPNHNAGVPKIEEQQITNLMPPNASSGDGQQSPGPHATKSDWEYVEEIGTILKTAYPLLALTLETMVDQFSNKFKATPEEEIYRFIFMLLQDGLQVCDTASSLLMYLLTMVNRHSVLVPCN